MDQNCDSLHPSAPLENDDLEQRLEKRLSDFNCFNNSINNIKEIIPFLKDKNNNSKKKNKNYKTITTKMETYDPSVIITTTTSSVTFISHWNCFDSDTKNICISMQIFNG